MTAFLWLGVWLLMVATSVWAHEAAHVGVATRLGWEYHGMFFKPSCLGVGVRLEPSTPEANRFLWEIALAGPIASLVMAGAFWVAEPIPGAPGIIFGSLAALNLAIAVINLVPTPITDGGHIVHGLLGKQVRWRHVAALWASLEVVALAWFVLTW